MEHVNPWQRVLRREKCNMEYSIPEMQILMLGHEDVVRCSYDILEKEPISGGDEIDFNE